MERGRVPRCCYTLLTVKEKTEHGGAGFLYDIWDASRGAGGSEFSFTGQHKILRKPEVVE